jgi:hypothetical protein
MSAVEIKIWSGEAMTLIEVAAEPATTLDRGWRERWSITGRQVEAEWCSSSPAHCSARVAASRAQPLLQLAGELTRVDEESR